MLAELLAGQTLSRGVVLGCLICVLQQGPARLPPRANAAARRSPGRLALLSPATAALAPRPFHMRMPAGSGAAGAAQAAREAALRAKRRNNGRIPPYPGMRSRVPSSGRLVDLSHGHGSPGNGAPLLAPAPTPGGGGGAGGSGRGPAGAEGNGSVGEQGADGSAAAAARSGAAAAAPAAREPAAPRLPGPAHAHACGPAAPACLFERFKEHTLAGR